MWGTSGGICMRLGLVNWTLIANWGLNQPTVANRSWLGLFNVNTGFRYFRYQRRQDWQAAWKQCNFLLNIFHLWEHEAVDLFSPFVKFVLSGRRVNILQWRRAQIHVGTFLSLRRRSLSATLSATVNRFNRFCYIAFRSSLPI